MLIFLHTEKVIRGPDLHCREESLCATIDRSYMTMIIVLMFQVQIIHWPTKMKWSHRSISWKIHWLGTITGNIWQYFGFNPPKVYSNPSSGNLYSWLVNQWVPVDFLNPPIESLKTWHVCLKQSDALGFKGLRILAHCSLLEGPCTCKPSGTWPD